MQQNTGISLALDTHVHFYEQYNLANALHFAWQNLTSTLQAYTLENPVASLVWTRFSKDVDLYQELERSSDSVGGWGLDPDFQSPLGFLARHRDQRELFIFKGRQLVSAEGLEILLVGSDDTALEGRPAGDIIRHYGDSHLVILPWGVGKWLGRRGLVMADLIASDLATRFMLGDNSSRPAFWSPIPAFIEAEKRHMRVLPGTDPLPIAGQESRIGAHGILLDTLPETVLQQPNVIREAIQRGSPHFKTVMDERENLLRFLINQLRIRIP